MTPRPSDAALRTKVLTTMEHLAFHRTPDTWAAFDRLRQKCENVRGELGDQGAGKLTAFLNLLTQIEQAAGRDGQMRTMVLTVGDQAFRCSQRECGSNCFHQPHPVTRPDLYECNGCGARYSSA